MVWQGRAPGVEYSGYPDVGTEMFGIGRNRQQGLSRRFEQQLVDDRLVLIGDVADRCRRRSYEPVLTG
jgi:hypothetical protein